MAKTLEEVRADVMNLSLAGFKKCPMSYSIYTQEAQDLNSWMQPDISAIIAAGCNPAFIEELPFRIEILRDSDAKLVQLSESALGIYKKSATEGFQVQKDLYTDFCHAFRNDETMLNEVKTIHKAKGDPDAIMIQNLREYGELGKSNVSALKAMSFELSRLDYSIELSKSLEIQLANANAEVSSSLQAQICNKAYLHLKVAVKEIRTNGKFVNKGNKERLHGYASEYMRQKALKYRASKKSK
jgi:hypothetical protein